MSLIGLLPQNSAAWERALAAAMSDALPVPIVAAMDPATAPVALLPWLAAHYGARLWFSDWPVSRKRLVASEAPLAAFEVGTRAGAHRFLGYVDATLVDAVAHPARFVMGRAVVGRTPIGHPAFVGRYLVRVATAAPPRSFVTSRARLGRARLKTPDRTPLDRCLVALRAAKAPETEIRVDFGHHRRLRLADAPQLGAYRLGEFVARTKL
jgi:P2-related tail formation protein